MSLCVLVTLNCLHALLRAESSAWREFPVLQRRPHSALLMAGGSTSRRVVFLLYGHAALTLEGAPYSESRPGWNTGLRKA